MTLDELLEHFICGRRNLSFYIDNDRDNISDRYDFDELINYGHYQVVDWQFNVEEQKLLVEIK